jgi:hypothetical protein
MDVVVVAVVVVAVARSIAVAGGEVVSSVRSGG